jgi:hypothetical protein
MAYVRGVKTVGSVITWLFYKAVSTDDVMKHRVRYIDPSSLWEKAVPYLV